MVRLKEPTKYHGVSLPSDLIEEIKDHIKDNRLYRSVASYVSIAAVNQMNYERDHPKVR